MLDTEQIAALLEQYVVALEKHKQAKFDYETARQAVLGLIPEEPGTHEIDGGSIKATVVYPSRLKWNMDELLAFYGSTFPPYVKLSASIDKTTLNRLPEEERAMLIRASNETVGSPKIDVVRP